MYKVGQLTIDQFVSNTDELNANKLESSAVSISTYLLTLELKSY